MSAETAVVAVVQIGGAVILAPLIPGFIATVEARLQGRRGASPLQPYRELRRLWNRSRVTPEVRTVIYELAPVVAATSVFLALLMLPIGGLAPAWPLGNDAFVLVGLLALGRLAIVLSAWDTGGGFGLMGAGRDLTFSIFVEALLLLVLVLLAIPAGSTDLVAISAAASDGLAWANPARWAATVGFAIVVVAETGRRPIDNPDTHLELTMTHEGPLLEYAGRDVALLEWASAARHWIVLVLAGALLLPHPDTFWVQLAILAGWVAASAVAIAVFEITQVKMRILRIPLLLGAGSMICLIGLTASLLGVSL